ncbi:Aluminum-activated malate transporter 1 [Hibiscus syriacus]|uniref:Aluminum-activated malate transporter 1 n=1 Tax=Hibiscus syriacus TaxID=106335 RepID=A0A6A3AX61_HIBSY|nr:Aluminum-activated malate transporter 1 [Hibiscus syriacus]
MKIASKTKKQGQDDPRRIVRSLKVGLAVSLVLLLYYFYPLYDGFGQEGALWVVLTVVLAFEISVGATLGKGLNRMLATLVAGALGVGAHCSSTLSGRKGKPILVATFVFIIDVITTFMRFIPTVKARYPYGHLIFILTFCLVSISSYRDDQVLEMAHDRLILQDGNEVMVRSGTVIHGKCTSKSETLLGTVLTKLKLLTATLTVKSSSANTHIESSKKAAEDLKSLLKTNLWEEADLLQIIPAASVTSPLLEIIECVEKIAEAVNELGNAASFRQSNVTVLSEQPHSIHQESIQQGSNTALPVPHCVITVAE